MGSTITKSLRPFILCKREMFYKVLLVLFFNSEAIFYNKLKKPKTKTNSLFTCVIQSSFQHEGKKQCYFSYYSDRLLQQTNSLFTVVASLASIRIIQLIYFFSLPNQDSYRISQICLLRNSVVTSVLSIQ